jgi:hypothetical protein
MEKNQMRIWPISIILEPDREIEMEIRASTGRNAVALALAKLVMNDGELLHVIHVGRPSPLIQEPTITASAG